MRDWVDARGFAVKSRRTWDSSRRQLLALEVPVGAERRLRVLGELRLDEVGPAVYDAVVAALRSAGMRSRTIQIRTDHLRASLRVAVEDGVVPELPTLRRVRVTDRRAPRWLAPAQTAQLLAALDAAVAAGRVSPVSALAIRTQEALFLRPGEVLTRRWEDYDRTARRLRVAPVELPDGRMWTPKAGSARTVPVPQGLARALAEEWMRQGRPGSGWMFPGEHGSPLTTFKKTLARACRDAGVPELHPHALRHTGATRWAAGGAARRALMEAGGWASGAMLDEVYEHTLDGQLTGYADALEAAPATPDELPQPDRAAGGSSKT